ncbi:MAG: thioredoxin [Verrucomicrobia bacterium]|nr:thioredoxin [Verrucomicrobiota bacterium]
MAAPNMLTLTESNFKEQVVDSPIPVLVDFWAEWCGPCKMLGPILEELATDYDGRVKIGKLNIDDSPSVANEYGIRAIPTMLIFKGGQVAEQVVGLRSKRDLKANLDKFAV